MRQVLKLKPTFFPARNVIRAMDSAYNAGQLE